ncbi:MAG: FmdE family protein [Pseudomonadota bacterium]
MGPYSFDEFLEAARSFHGNPAPGLIIGGYMIEQAKTYIPEGILYNAVSETTWCLPDAVQMLTPCTVGNGWLKILNLGLYAVSLYDKFEGTGVRVFLDVSKLDPYPEIKTWYLKLKPKKEQDSELLLKQISQAQASVCSAMKITMRPEYLLRRSKGKISICPICSEAYPLENSSVCRACQGESPYLEKTAFSQEGVHNDESLNLKTVPLAKAVGKKLLHDITTIVPGVSKGAEFKKGQTITAGDVCRLQQIGKYNIYLQEENLPGKEWVHEDEVAKAFGEAMSGNGVEVLAPPAEGKINLSAAQDGLFVADVSRLEQFNLLPDVMAASRQSFTIVKKGAALAGARAIPLYLSQVIFQKSLKLLRDAPLFQVLPMRKAKVGILVTGSEVFNGLIEDRFEPIITGKVKDLGCTVTKSIIVPDDLEAIKNGVNCLIASGSDLIVTTAGLSVDPDDVTRQGLVDLFAEDMLYGAPILPGAMTLLARIGQIQIMGVPACALYFKTTSFDLLLPRLLAGLTITRSDLAKMAHGGLCLACKNCTFPKCAFGK